MTTLFVKARVQAFQDIPNLFALPQPNMDELVPVEELEKYTKQEYTTRLMEAGDAARDWSTLFSSHIEGGVFEGCFSTQTG